MTFRILLVKFEIKQINIHEINQNFDETTLILLFADFNIKKNNLNPQIESSNAIQEDELFEEELDENSDYESQLSNYNADSNDSNYTYNENIVRRNLSLLQNKDDLIRENNALKVKLQNYKELQNRNQELEKLNNALKLQLLYFTSILNVKQYKLKVNKDNNIIDKKSSKFFLEIIPELIQTNNCAELYVVIRALEICDNDKNIVINMDSTNIISFYQIDVKKNNDLVDNINKMIKKCKGKTYFKHVNAHSRIYENDQADRLAYLGTKKKFEKNQKEKLNIIF
ncbi:41534_t:CDS:2 [Gigaspora margarita]|uniref:41534_t:CDS:1 n=1 Tax=Gigaspora margarita TaxID=4874 RepID=A0ABN7U533_GIGMA|nr:41534_t:CDS:2 [Gigaspora margarita]